MPPRAKRPARPDALDIEDVEDLLAAMTDHGHTLWLWRRAGDRWSFLESRSPETFRVLGIREATRQRTGGGDYRVRVRGTNGQWGAQRNFSIEGEQKPIPSSGPVAQSAASPAPVAASLELPGWVERIVLPIGIALGTAIANKMLAEPKVDPLLLELVKRNGKGDGVDPIELQRLVLEAERRGETRGQEVGELRAKRERVPVVSNGSGVVDAIRELAPMARDLVASARSQRGGDERRRALPSSTLEAPAGAQTDVTIAPPADIVPSWLRPVMAYRSMLLNAADYMTAGPIAGLVIENADDATWAAMREADAAGRLESDLFAAIPELAQSERRQAFVAQLLADVRAELVDDGSPAEPVPVPAAKAPKKAAAKRVRA